MSSLKFLNKEYIIAGEGFNRWMVPASALMVHLCVGMGYGMSVFWLPMSRIIGTAQGTGKPLACPADMNILAQLFTTTCDWRVVMPAVIFSILFFMLGVTTAIFGNWLEHEGPRKSAFYSCICFVSFFLMTAVSMYFHQLWLAWVGAVIGGIGLGLGYITPVGTLIRWFPDRVGMSTAFAVAGFGGGAMVGSPFAQALMDFYKTPLTTGVWETFLTMAIIYCVFMMMGAYTIRVAPPGWLPKGFVPKVKPGTKMVDTGKGLVAASDFNVATNRSMATPQFWFCWGMLFLNVSAGIGVISMASPMLQEIFAGNLIGAPGVPFDSLTEMQRGQVAMIAAGFTGLLSLFNILGRLWWASLSDIIGRKMTYFIFFLGGAVLYASIPTLAKSLNLVLFLAAVCGTMTFYGGGFATIPAYLADLFGTQYVGAIHGRLLTAWSSAGLISPLIINIIRDTQINAGIPRAEAYSMTLYIMAIFLLIGFVCAVLVRPVHSKHYMTDEQMAEAKAKMDAKIEALQQTGAMPVQKPTTPIKLVGVWLFVGIPLAYGVYQTFLQTIKMFR